MIGHVQRQVVCRKRVLRVDLQNATVVPVCILDPPLGLDHNAQHRARCYVLVVLLHDFVKLLLCLGEPLLRSVQNP